ncbi:similar to Saccharomyces cerevisiae YJL101C GSH1 Gamma glutamylcysteine synthetase catalyzes the first step in glutathione (GSH) biosynthesis [Maudiozyma barnettii]|uniref:Glutamate--cysteine ligase n=1 Tax=Maudiozyma barnettii TaxID=61262 RepID=A0A8H2VG59_9SACH|nr:glutamate--cysteine ligase [Kazachstania barnettii]CAB4254579.1 similar to Saccharomyces cerevisiae YJL101C GSH1 Gamma glutamylcysteine synthetase catalyzes the first step in glutathione (GSH) biosynthesis [Kazachstania barnettii]CAD1782621.1 similar to Saccharomyces cerevisiae YJL101C GSH1 Gamma glutamylcysteine synthetase catalyzes the first step in glutathione (GSH) biosynthesis [Kazachstania barnettii]
MGLLAAGTPLTWYDSRRYNEHVRTEGIEQLLQVMKATASRDHDPLYWGDELEYMLMEIDDTNCNTMLDVVDDKIITDLNTDDYQLCKDNNVEIHPEYGRFMVEATPGGPYHGLANGHFVESNMVERRKIIDWKLNQYARRLPKGKRLSVLTMTSFPRLGASGKFLNIENQWDHKNSASRSLFLPDEVINRHVRFPTLTANIRVRRGEKVCINLPMYKDKFTPEYDTSIQDREWFIPEDLESKLASKKGHIYLDAMGFGMGSACLQMTFQAPNIEKSRFLYDSLVNFAPIMLAVSAAAPAFKGWLVDQDVRWNVISGAVDCRTPFERSVKPILPKYNKDGLGGINEEEQSKLQRIPKSRYSCVDLFLGGKNKHYNRTYNDTEVPINDKVLNRLLENDIFPFDYDLAKHFAHLFIRDPIAIYEESINQDNMTSTNHFENIQSTNWQTLRFKVPNQNAVPSNKCAPGWRIEFRPLDVQITDFENAAYANFIFLITEAILILGENLNPYLKMSHVWENMDKAHSMDAIIKEKFHWKDTFNTESSTTSLMSINEIFHNSKSGIFATFINPILMYRGLVNKEWQELKESANYQRLYYYLKVISDRASGKTVSVARFIRNLIISHPDYKQDSQISELINYDLTLVFERLTNLDNANDEITALFGRSTAEYLTSTKLNK